MNPFKTISVLTLLLALAACSSPQGRRELLDREGSFGYSVRQMIRVQTYATGVTTSPMDPLPVDGERTARALKAWRSDPSSASGASFATPAAE